MRCRVPGSTPVVGDPPRAGGAPLTVERGALYVKSSAAGLPATGRGAAADSHGRKTAMTVTAARSIGVVLLLALAALAAAGPAAAGDPMLTGLKEARIAFDITAGEPARLLSILDVIGETRDGLVKQGIAPRIILAFRGPATVLLRADRSGVKPEDRETAARVAAKLRELRGAAGVEQLAVCEIAMRLTRTPKEQLVPEVTVVENGWYTLVGAQAKGYAYIAP